MEWGTAISALASAVGIAKDMREIGKGFDQAEMKAKLAVVLDNLADVKIALVDARDAMKERDQEILRLTEAFAFRGNLVEHQGYKYEARNNEPVGRPFCPRCEQNLGRYYRLTHVGSYKSQCPECKTLYSDAPMFLWE